MAQAMVSNQQPTPRVEKDCEIVDLLPWLSGGVFVLVDLCFQHVDSRLHQGILNAYC